MIELGQLERRHEDFAKRNVRVIAVSLEDGDKATKTQAEFPHLLVLADHGRGLSNAAQLVHPQSTPEGADTSAPTTILVDRRGIVRWLFRPGEAITRLSPDDVLHAIDAYMPQSARSD
jgi:alkyl hydroperoxide reductase subunit AhpC